MFYAPDIDTLPELPEEEARHALRVLRMTAGDEISLTDGKGHFYQAILQSDKTKHCVLEIISHEAQPPLWDFRLHIAVAPTKNMDRMEWLCEKATEIGIDEITFLNCRFSERREIKTARLEKILVSALKQSQKATLPQLNEIADFMKHIRQPFDGQKFIAHCREGIKPLLKELYRPGENAWILIGPEGDFSPDEVEAAIRQGFAPISLGNSRLRTETAALAAIQNVHVLN